MTARANHPTAGEITPATSARTESSHRGGKSLHHRLLHSIETRVYGLDGMVRVEHRDMGELGAPKRWGTRTAKFTPKTWPLERNRVMVGHVARCVAAESEGKRRAILLGLGAPWSKTHGTQHTITRAREASIPVCEFSYPRTQPWPVIP